jgi:hypothetical protein
MSPTTSAKSGATIHQQKNGGACQKSVNLKINATNLAEQLQYFVSIIPHFANHNTIIALFLRTTPLVSL